VISLYTPTPLTIPVSSFIGAAILPAARLSIEELMVILKRAPKISTLSSLFSWVIILTVFKPDGESLFKLSWLQVYIFPIVK